MNLLQEPRLGGACSKGLAPGRKSDLNSRRASASRSETRTRIASLARPLTFSPAAAALLVWGVLGAQQPALALDPARPALSAHVPAEAKLARPLGRLPGDRRLNLAIGLPLRHPEALTTLLRQLYDPTDPRYHQYLTPAEFTAEFGPAEQDYQAVIAFAQANGLRVTTVHPNRVVLDVSGTVADIERTFHLSLHTYRHPVEDRVFYAPDTEPTLELAVASSSHQRIERLGPPASREPERPPGRARGRRDPRGRRDTRGRRRARWARTWGGTSGALMRATFN